MKWIFDSNMTLIIIENVYNFHFFNHFIIIIIIRFLIHMFWKQCLFHFYIMYLHNIYHKNLNSFIFNHYYPILSSFSLKLLYIFQFIFLFISFHSSEPSFRLCSIGWNEMKFHSVFQKKHWYIIATTNINRVLVEETQGKVKNVKCASVRLYRYGAVNGAGNRRRWRRLSNLIEHPVLAVSSLLFMIKAACLYVDNL